MPADAHSRFDVRASRPGDEPAILELFARSFHQPRTLEHWRWKYALNPFGNGHISLAFDESRALVGHYSGYPVPFAIGGESVLAHQIGDTMTDPSVRHVGRGPSSVLGRTAGHFYDTFCEGLIAFNYGFNVANIQKFSLRFLRSDRVEPVAFRRRDLRRCPFQRLSRLERYARGISFELVRSAGGEWDELAARTAPQYGFLVHRDARYVEWRYFGRPDVAYTVVAVRKWRRLAGWLVVRMAGATMRLGDLLVDADHADVVEPALRHLTSVCGAEAIEAWLPPRPAWIGSLAADLGLEQAPEPQNLSVMVVPFTMGDATQRMRRSLYYTMGDSDLF